MSTFDFYDSLILLAVAIGTSLMGIAIGWWLKDRRSSNALVSEARARGFPQPSARSGHDPGRRTEQAHHAYRRSRTRVGQSQRRDPSCEPEAIILDSISQMVMSNKRLHNKLSSAEHQFGKNKSRKIDFHLAEARDRLATQLPNRRAFDDQSGITHGSSACRRQADCDSVYRPHHLKCINVIITVSRGDRLSRARGDVLTARRATATWSCANRRQQ